MLNKLQDYIKHIIDKEPIPIELEIRMIHDDENRLYYIFTVTFDVNEMDQHQIRTYSPEKMLKLLKAYFED